MREESPIIKRYAMRINLLLFLFLVTTNLLHAQQEATTLSGKKVLLYEDSTWVYADGDLLYNIKANKFIRSFKY